MHDTPTKGRELWLSIECNFDSVSRRSGRPATVFVAWEKGADKKGNPNSY